MIANLQANLLYWKECVDTQDLNQTQIGNNNSSNNSNDGNTKINRLILEDIESEISDDSKWTDGFFSFFKDIKTMKPLVVVKE